MQIQKSLSCILPAWLHLNGGLEASVEQQHMLLLWLNLQLRYLKNVGKNLEFEIFKEIYFISMVHYKNFFW